MLRESPNSCLHKQWLVLALFLLITTALLVNAASQQSDRFAWLEEIKGERALAWVQSQNERTLKQLASDPRYQQYYDVALAIALDKNRIPASTIFDGWLFNGWVYNLWQDENNARGLWRRARLDSYKTPVPTWQVLLDIDALAKSEDRAWELHSPVFLPPNGNRCMIGLLQGGMDATAYREFDFERVAFVPDGFVLPETKGLSLVWKDRNTLLVAMDGAAPPDENSMFVVKEWRREQPLSEAKVLFRGRNSIVLQDYTDQNGHQLLVLTESGALRQKTYWKLDANGQRTQIMLPPQAQLFALHRGEWVFSINEDWSSGTMKWKGGSLLSVPEAQATASLPSTFRLLMTPGPSEIVVRTDSTRDGLLAISYSNVRGQLFSFTLKDERWIRQRVLLPDNGTINFAMSDPSSDTAFVRFESFLQPPTVYAIDVAANRAEPVKTLPPQFDAENYIAEQLEASSRDKTRVPYFIVRPKALKKNGQAPTLIHGYGYQGFPQFPYYSGFLGRLWLDQGGVYVLANIRGGGEFGASWHVTKTQRQKVYDDFIAVAEDLIRRKVTSPPHLGIEGMSAGGLLMGVMITQRPDLFNAAVIEVPILDLLNDNLLGGRERFAAELGSLNIPEERAFLEQTSPYQNLKKREDFLVPFLVTSTTDEKAHPAFARKFAAKMESLGMPFLFYESADGGHNIWSTPQQQAMYKAMFYSYLAQQLMESRCER